MARLLLGQHPQGAYGLFISKPGVAVENTAPTDSNNLLFSSEWGNIANIAAAGVCGINADVVMPSLGFRPFVRFESKYGDTYNVVTNTGTTQSAGQFQSRRYDWTRFTLVYSSDTVFQIQTTQPGLDGGAANENSQFRYIVMNFPVNA